MFHCHFHEGLKQIFPKTQPGTFYFLALFELNLDFFTNVQFDDLWGFMGFKLLEIATLDIVKIKYLALRQCPFVILA